MSTLAQVHRYAPVGSAVDLFRSKSPEVLLSGSAGTGKSRACLEKVHAMCLRYPGMRAVILRKTAVSLTATGLVTFREIVAREALASGEVTFYAGSRERPAAYVYLNGSQIIVGGMDKADKIMSSEYDMAYVQEATELFEDDWEKVTTRLRHGRTPFMQLIADCNPGPPHHWLKRRCDAAKTQMVYCKHEDNPRFYRNGEWTAEGQVYLDRLDALTGVRRERLRFGRWAAAEGLVYDTFDPAVHFTDRFSHRSHPPDAWPRYLAVDFGYTNPFVAQWWCEDPDGRLYMYREIYRTQTLVEDHARKILKLHKSQERTEPSFTAVICDHDEEDRATLERYLGRSTVQAHKAVSDGIQAVAGRLKVAGDGKPRLFLCRDALAERDEALYAARKPCCTAEEIQEYAWDSRHAPGSNAPRESPVKENDHGMDAMRYMVAQADLVGRPRVRFTPGRQVAARRTVF